MRSQAVPYRSTCTLLCRRALRWVALSLLLLLLGKAAPAIANDYAYVLDPASITIYPIISSPGGPSDRALGQATARLLLPDGLFGLRIGLSPDGRNAYVVTTGRPGMGSRILTLAVNRTTGALTLQGNDPATLATGGLAISEKFVCTAHAGGSSSLPTAPYYAIFCFARDPQSGALRLTDTFGLSTRPADVTFGATDTLYTTLYNRNEVGQLRLNPATGKLSWLQPPTVRAGESPVPIAYNSVSPLVYVGNTGHQGTIGFYPINRDGTLGAPREVKAGLYPGALAVDHAGKFLVVANATSNTVMNFDASTGQLFATNSTADSPEAVEFDHVGRSEGPVVYVMSRAASRVATFTIQNGTGRLSLVSVVNTQKQPRSMATTPAPSR